jgi:hypothetical protein
MTDTLKPKTRRGYEGYIYRTPTVYQRLAGLVAFLGGHYRLDVTAQLEDITEERGYGAGV